MKVYFGEPNDEDYNVDELTLVVFLSLQLAGLISFAWGCYHLHLFVKPSYWVWGRGGWDGYLESWGCGPLFALFKA